MRASIKSMAFLTCLAFCSMATQLRGQEKKSEQKCRSVALSIALNGSESYEKRISDLTFKMQPLKSTGWMYSLEDSDGNDYIYPVNPPLRFNNSQTLGAGYGETARQSLNGERELRFLLNRTDYDKLQPIVTDALWPSEAKDPDHAVDRYFAMLNKLRTGLLRLMILSSDVSKDDKINSASFKVEFITPSDFKFDLSLSPQIANCPAPVSSDARLSRGWLSYTNDAGTMPRFTASESGN